MPYSDKIKMKALNMYKDDISVTKISKLKEMPSRSTIYKWINESNVDLKNPEISNRKNKRLSDKEKSKIIELYKNSDMYVKDIAKKFNIHVSTIYKITDGIYRDSPFSHKKNGYSEDIKKKVEDMYNSGMYIDEIESKLNIYSNTISRWLKVKGYDVKRGMKNKINKEDFFDNIDNEIKSYFIGWLMADGATHVYDKQHFIKLGVQLSDKNIVDGFLYHIDSSYNPYIKEQISFGSKHKAYICSLTSVHMVKKLIKYGIVPNKTGKEYIPKEYIPDKFIKDFIRGYFDGDGITDIKRKRSGFCGPNKMLKQIQNILGTNKRIYKSKGMSYFQSGIKFSKKLYDYIYKDSNIWLPRKRKRLKFISGNTEVTNKNKNLLVP